MGAIVFCIGIIGTVQVVRIQNHTYFFQHPLRVECVPPGRDISDDYVTDAGDVPVFFTEPDTSSALYPFMDNVTDDE